MTCLLSERRNRNGTVTQSPESRKQAPSPPPPPPPPRPSILARAISSPRSSASAVQSLPVRSPKAALKSATRPPSSRPRSRTVVSRRESFGKTESCTQRSEDGYLVSVGTGIAFAEQSFASDGIQPIPLHDSGGRAELGYVHDSSTPEVVLGEQRLSEIEAGSPANRKNTRARL